MTSTGDVLLSYNPSTAEIDINYTDGQPDMTDGLESCVILAIFGKNNAQNGMTDDPAEKYTSQFLDVIQRATVSNQTKQDGEKALESQLSFLLTEKIASKVTVTGYILSAYSIGWAIDIEAPTGETRYAINWEKGALTFGYAR